MPKSENQKIKILALARLFEEETDETNGLSMPEIIAKLAEQGIDAERKSIYRDIEALRDFGMDIQTLRKPHVAYHLASRDFSLSELMLVIDAVQSSRFLTHKQADYLSMRLQNLASSKQRNQLMGKVHVLGRIKKPEESAFSTVDTIRLALTNKKKIQFSYLEYDASGKKRLRKDGRIYLETPVSLIYASNLYYLITYSEKYEALSTYRVDRMRNVSVSEEPALRNQTIATFNPEKHVERSFGMFSGEETAVTFLVKQELMSSVMDRFFSPEASELSLGKARVSKLDDEHSLVHTRVMESPAFYGWLAQFGSDVTIQSPAGLAERYRAYLENIMKAYL